MSNQMRVTDSVRTKVLEALLKKSTVQPNIRQLKRYTGLHKATIKSSLDFLQKEGVLKGFGPKVDFKKLGYKLEVLNLFQADLSQKKVFERFVGRIEKDPHVYWLSSIIGASNWNLICRHVHKDVESYHADMKKRYMAIEGYYDLMKDMQSFFSVDPIFKNESRTSSIIELIKAEP